MAEHPDIVEIVTDQEKPNLKALRVGQALLVEGVSYQSLWQKAKRIGKQQDKTFKIQKHDHGYVIWVTEQTELGS